MLIQLPGESSYNNVTQKQNQEEGDPQKKVWGKIEKEEDEIRTVHREMYKNDIMKPIAFYANF